MKKNESDIVEKKISSNISRKTSIGTLFTDFLKFGLFTFGGGWSIVAQMEKIYVEDRKVVSSHELLDLTSVGRSLPGTMIGNIAILFGYSQQGIPGALVSLFAMILPPFLVLLIVASCYTAFRTNFWVASAMSGIRCAVVPIILTAALKMFNGAFKFPPCYFVTVICVLLYVFFNVSCVYLVIFGAVCGLIISDFYARKEV
ncbi:chromate transporter [Oribacterium sp. P6A1]|uniref:chromate transporter n=1 Tax=Oribacterium sp. P6A1 TaxID=1410612 RepID=UPI0009DF8202|nr:chromate transporter [Oribacterium sp. P6A1]